MGWKMCSGCKAYYHDSKGGCTNSGCQIADRAAVGRISNTPIHPLSKEPMSGKAVDLLKPLKSTEQGIRKPIRPLPATPVPQSVLRVPTPAAIADTKDADTKDADTKDSAPKGADSKGAEAKPGKLSAAEWMVLESGYHILYRGDTRPPNQLPQGFEAWVPLDVETARQIVRRCQGSNDSIKLPPSGKRLQDVFNGLKGLNLLTLGRQIKLEKTHDTFHISTDPSVHCGGYSGDYIYGMRFKTLVLVDGKRADPCAFGNLSPVRAKLVMDHADLDSATLIAIGVDPKEVAFLTSIPRSCIYKYKAPKDTEWTSLIS